MVSTNARDGAAARVAQNMAAIERSHSYWSVSVLSSIVVVNCVWSNLKPF